MAVHNTRIDPYTPERGYYECRSCGHRTTSSTHVATCQECDGAVHNIAVARE